MSEIERLRILVVGRSSRRARTPGLFAKGFAELGHSVLTVKPGPWARYLGERLAVRILVRRILGWHPDLVVTFSNHAPLGLVRALSERVPLVIYYPDYHDPISEETLQRAVQADLFILTNRGQINEFQAAGVKRVLFLTGGCDRDHHFPGRRPTSSRYRSQLAFIGRPARTDRVDFIRRIGQNFQLKIWGPGWDSVGLRSEGVAFLADYRQICAGADIVLGYDATDQVELYFSNRTWLTLGCGGFLLTRYVPGLEEILVAGVHLDWFRSTEECLDKICFYLDHPEVRATIAESGRRYAQEHFSFTRMAQQVIDATRDLKCGLLGSLPAKTSPSSNRAALSQRQNPGESRGQ